MMVSKESRLKSIDASSIYNLSLGNAYKLALRAKNKNDTKQANEILAIISRAIREDGKNGYYTGNVRFIGLQEHCLINTIDPEEF